MDNRWAANLAVAVVGGIAWWYGGHPGYETPEQQKARIEALEEERGGHLVYRWVDDRGVTQFTDTPPPRGDYETVRVEPDQNRVPAGSAGPGERPAN